MKIETLQKVLKYYLAHEDADSNLRDDIIDSLEICMATSERYEDIDCYDSQVTLIGTGTLVDLLNYYTYDCFGIVARRFPSYDREQLFTFYTYECRKHEPFAHFTNEQLRTGYEVIWDIWHDNETEGENGPDGALKR